MWNYKLKFYLPVLIISTFVKSAYTQNATTNSSTSPAAGLSTGSEYNGPGGWLRICQPGAGKYVGVETTMFDDCPSGYWFKDPLKIGCACGHGVWVFAKGWCDHTAKIIVANKGSCFNVNKDVKYIRNLGWSRSAYMPFHFVSSTGMEYIQPVPNQLSMSSEATHFHVDYNQHIGSVFRNNAVESMSGRFCVSEGGNFSRPLTLKYFIPKQPFMQKKSCFAYAGQDVNRFNYDAGYNYSEGLTLVDSSTTPFVKPKSWVTPADEKKCSSECASKQAFNASAPKNDSLTPDYYDPLYDEYFLADLKAMDWKNKSALPTAMPEQKCNETRQYNLTDKTLLEIKEQTKRMIQANLLFALRQTPAPAINYTDYNLMQKARKIMSKVCPIEEMPIAVLSGLHRMFRVALNESFFHYPFDQLGDDTETEKIAEGLEKCFQDAKPMSFLYDDMLPKAGNSSANASSPSNSTKPAPAKGKLVLPVCQKPKFLGVQYGFKSGLNRTIMSTLPCYLWSNVTDLDLVIETAWKTVMFTHYYCAKNFNNASIEFSVFEQKMERFFNRWIQHRWFYPGSALAGYKYIFQMFNLEKFAKAMDRCVSAARSFSVYRKWIKRPIYVKYLGGKLFEEQYDIPDDVASRPMDAFNPKLTHFNKKAYCLPNWHTPASNPGINYDPTSEYKPGCIKYRKEEWKAPYQVALGNANGWRDSLAIL